MLPTQLPGVLKLPFALPPQSFDAAGAFDGKATRTAKMTINPERRRARKIELMVMATFGLVVRVRNSGPLACASCRGRGERRIEKPRARSDVDRKSVSFQENWTARTERVFENDYSQGVALG